MVQKFQFDALGCLNAVLSLIQSIKTATLAPSTMVKILSQFSKPNDMRINKVAKT